MPGKLKVDTIVSDYRVLMWHDFRDDMPLGARTRERCSNTWNAVPEWDSLCPSHLWKLQRSIVVHVAEVLAFVLLNSSTSHTYIEFALSFDRQSDDDTNGSKYEFGKRQYCRLIIYETRSLRDQPMACGCSRLPRTERQGGCEQPTNSLVLVFASDSSQCTCTHVLY